MLSAEELVPWLAGGLLVVSLAQLAVLARAFSIYDRLSGRIDRLKEQLRKESQAARSWHDHVTAAEQLVTPDARRRPRAFAPEPSPPPAPPLRSQSGTPPIPARERPWSSLRPPDETVELQPIGGRHLKSVRAVDGVTAWT